MLTKYRLGAVEPHFGTLNLKEESMTDNEHLVLESAFDLFEYQCAVDCGVPLQGKLNGAYHDLMKACSKLACDNEGKLEISED